MIILSLRVLHVLSESEVSLSAQLSCYEVVRLEFSRNMEATKVCCVEKRGFY